MGTKNHFTSQTANLLFGRHLLFTWTFSLLFSWYFFVWVQAIDFVEGERERERKSVTMLASVDERMTGKQVCMSTRRHCAHFFYLTFHFCEFLFLFPLFFFFDFLFNKCLYDLYFIFPLSQFLLFILLSLHLSFLIFFLCSFYFLLIS